jgi:hypothetical protein
MLEPLFDFGHTDVDQQLLLVFFVVSNSQLEQIQLCYDDSTRKPHTRRSLTP